MPEVNDVFRASAPPRTAGEDLGLLADLPGRWVGKGFNLIARPAREGVSQQPAFFLELNGTHETLEFTAIGGAIPNRGSIEKTALLHAVHYLQTVQDCADDTFIHKEPGLWVHVPPTQEQAQDTYVRQAVIPHGDSLLAQSTFTTTVQGGPKIDPVSSLPFPIVAATPIPGLNDVEHATIEDPGYIDPYLHNELPGHCLPAGLDAPATIRDPTAVLRAQIDGQQIGETIVIGISTTAQDSGILNIPYVTRNANAARMDAIFWIEKVTRPPFDVRPSSFLQLQYVQRVILDFDGIHWPHISVATLVKSG